MFLYADSERDRVFREEWAKTGKKLDMGKGCVRFKKYGDLAEDVLAKTIKSITVDGYITLYESLIKK
jgi:hypothetical protein